MIQQVEFRLEARRRGCHLISGDILRQLPKLPQTGMLNVFVKHTSCGLTINENADPDVRGDMAKILDHIVPERESYYEHTMEGDDDMPAHAKSSLVGVSLTIPITGGRLNLGRWQGIYLCEFRDYGGSRTIVATIYS
ncbi:MAG: secondary thiamine-phosphate synthase enzyme YjbQ [Muribaculaceae bacterium]|nr:secondary thiamine-phosphate synthase enzyme YjbQ [Muribaculaceae bacterium]